MSPGFVNLFRAQCVILPSQYTKKLKTQGVYTLTQQGIYDINKKGEL